MNKNESLLKNTILLAIGTLITKGLLFVMVPFFSKWLTTESYGTFDLICTYTALLIPMIDLAVGEGIFRYSVNSNDREEIKENISNGLGVILINLIIFIIIIILLHLVFGFNNIIPFIILLFGELYNSHLRAVLRAIKRLDIYSISSAISVAFIAIACTIFIRYLNWGLNGIIVGYGIGYIIGNMYIISKIKYWNYVDLKSISFKGCKKLIRYSLPLVPNNISWWIMNVSDRLILNIVIGPIANGIYAIANKVPALCSSVFSMFSISWQQSAVENITSKSRNSYFNEIFNATISVMISLSILLLSTNFIFFDYIFDSKYSVARVYVPILITAILFSTLSQFFGGIQIGLKQTKENGISTVTGAIINILINLVFIKYIGIYAAALSTLISYFFVALIRCIRLRNIVVFRVSRKNIIILIIYSYFIAVSYLKIGIGLKLTNIVLGVIFFTFINMSFIRKLLKKVLLKLA